MKKKCMFFMRLFFLSVIMLGLTHQNVYAQKGSSRSIEGTVTNEKGEALQGVVVAVNNGSAKSLTDAAGKFKLTVASKGELRFSFTGYEDKVVSYNESSLSVNATLSPQSNALDEVVVVGYNTVKRKDVTGSVAGISQTDIRSRPVANAVEAMQGKVAGVDISSNERPGQVGSITIRGVRSLTASNSPLYVVDGIPLITGGIDYLNPNDIETIDVLKDASATAVFGSRGANGVIIITTKQGKAGKVTLSLNSSVRLDNLVDNNEMFNSAEYIEYKRWAYYYTGLNNRTGISTNPRGDQPTIANDRTLFAATADPTAWKNIARGWASGKWDGSKVYDTDWRGLVSKQNVTSDHVLSVSGGSDKVKGYASFGFLDNTGSIQGQAYKRYSAKASVDIAATKWLTFGNNISATYSVQEFGQNAAGVATIGSPQSGLYESARGIYPYAQPYDSLGERILFPGGDNAIKNVVDEWNFSKDQRTTLRAFGSIFTQVNMGNILPFLQGLKYRLNFGPDISYYRNGVYVDANSVQNGGSTNYAALYKNTNFSYTLDNLLYYDKVIGDHTLGVTLLMSQTSFDRETSNVIGNGVPIRSQLWNALTSGTVTGQLSTASDLVQQQLMSYMARINYSYKDRYVLTASVRNDGASQLAEGKKFSMFPSAAIAWRINKEKFFKVSAVDDLKLRIGAGVTGNSAIAPYSTQGSISALFVPFGGTNAAGAIPNSVLANLDLGWEKTTQYNLGIDFAMFKRRISGSIDAYTSETTELLMQRSIPTVTGFSTTFANIGKTANEGIDISITTVNVQQKDFTWSTVFNAGWQKERIVSLSNGKQDDINNNWFINQPIGVIYGFKALGLWQATDSTLFKQYTSNNFSAGSVRVADLNKDNKIDPNNDRQIIGWTRPRWVLGMTNTVTFKNWDVSIFVYSRLNYMYNTGGEGQAARQMQRKIDYYTPLNPGAQFQKPIFNAGGATGDSYFQALGYMDASFVKVRNISLGYTFDAAKLGKKSGISSLKAYAQISNPGMLFSKIKHLDMDVVGPTWNRGFTLGINATF
jgi:TonB-linked SusC/RagA family outer membrane protein